MKKEIIRKTIVLLLVFIAALIFYFISAQNTMEKEETIYASMTEPQLLVVYAAMDGRKVNPMHGYVQDLGNAVARSSITLLPENRELEIIIENYGNTVTEIQYEIRNLSMDRLVENTRLESWEQREDGIYAALPIQNLITKEEPYLLTLILDTGESKINYYTRILWSDYTYGADFIQLAEEFSRKSLNNQTARDLVSYLETDPSEDNSSLGMTTIRTSFDHLTWYGLKAEMVGDPSVTLKELDGTMGQVQVCYQIHLTDSANQVRTLDVKDYYTMRWNEQRIYMMNYSRQADEVFSEIQPEISGKRLMLGITNDQMVSSLKSPDHTYIAFETNRELWRYDQEEGELLRIFSFAGVGDEDIRSSYDSHDIKILSVRDNGDVYFLVYGYMNRGTAEGQMGVTLYHYIQNRDTVQENIFIPVEESFESLQWELNQLAYLNENEMLYLLLNQSICGIDLSSNELVVVARGLTLGEYAVSSNQQRIAWKEETNPGQNDRIHVMDLNTAQKDEIQADQGDYIQVLGFVGSDLIYGLGHQTDQWISNGRVRELPMYALYIIGTDMEVESQYQEDGIYISDVNVQDGRIHLNRMVKVSDQSYVFQNEDTIVCNEDISIDPLEGIGWYVSQDMGKRYFVQLDQTVDQPLQTREPSSYSYRDNVMAAAATVSREDRGNVIFCAYAQGQFLGSFTEFKEAVDAAYDDMGLVTDENQHILWDRINRRNAASSRNEGGSAMERHLSGFSENTLYEDGLMLIDARGCDLNQVLYFIDKGYPVIAYTENGAVRITGYDTYNITITDSSSGESYKMGLGDATTYFQSLGNDFICGKMIR